MLPGGVFEVRFPPAFFEAMLLMHEQGGAGEFL